MRGRTIVLGITAFLLLVLAWFSLPALLPRFDLTVKPARYILEQPHIEAPDSFVSVSMVISLREMERLLNLKLSQTLTKQDQTSHDKKTRIQVEQNGALSLHGRGSTLELVIPLSFKIRRGKLKTNGKITVVSDIALAIREDWTPQVDIHSKFHWDKKPYVRLGPFKFRIAGPVGDKIQNALDDMDKDLRKKVARTLDLRKKAEKEWANLYEARQLGKKKSPVWLAVEPIGLFMAPITSDASNIHLALGITARLSTTVGEQPKPVSPQPLPPLKRGLPAERGFVIRLPVLLDYAGLRAQLKTKQVGKRIRLEEGAITPTDFEIYTSGQNLVVGVSFEGDAPGWWLDTHGTVYLTGEPVFDPQTHVLSLRNFQYTRQVNNPLVHAATWVLRDSLRIQLERRMRWDLTKRIEKTRTDAENYLNKPLGRGIEMTGRFDTLNIGDVHLQAEGIVVDLEARGQLGVSFAEETSSELPQQ